MGRWALSFFTESVLAYVGGGLLAFPLNAAVFLALDWAFEGAAHRTLNLILYAPVLAAFWVASAILAVAAYRVDTKWLHRSPQQGSAGEWVWILGAIIVVLGFFSERSLGYGWERQALYDLFVNHEEIGNLATAPLYMGLAYSLTRRLLRSNAKRRGDVTAPN